MNLIVKKILPSASGAAAAYGVSKVTPERTKGQYPSIKLVLGLVAGVVIGEFVQSFVERKLNLTD